MSDDYHFKFKCKGLSLVDLIISLALISIMTAFVLQGINAREKQFKIYQLNENVKELQKAVSIAVRSACNSHTFSTPTMTQLLSDSSLQSSLYSTNPVNGTALTFSINWNPPFLISVFADMGSPANANALLSASQAQRVSGQMLVWDQTISTESGDITSDGSFRQLFEPRCW